MPDRFAEAGHLGGVTSPHYIVHTARMVCAVRFLHLGLDSLLPSIQVIERVPCDLGTMAYRYLRMITHQRGKVPGDMIVALAQIVHFGRSNFARVQPWIFGVPRAAR